MRIDHVAYQQAARVAGFGLFLQAAVGLTLLVLGAVGGDTTLRFASIYVLIGTVVWLSLVVVFHQHKLERLEALEADELASSRGVTIFDREIEATRVAARRLHLMHTWMMPTVSVAVALGLAGAGWWILDWFGRQGDPEGTVPPFAVTERLGWAMAISLGLALICFIFSRFVAGMAKQPAWQNLRGGAGYMVGNALVCLAAAVGFGFQFAHRTAVLEGVSYGIAIFMIGLAAEILLNFVLQLYRPRRPGETPRPAFDSRILSLLAAPDSIVRSINEAVNYQFGFDITSSWGYQLLLRSFAWLVAVAVLAMIALSCIATVDADQQALKLRFGAVKEVHGPGLLLKLPWPIETVELHEVGRLQQLPLSINPQLGPAAQQRRANFWVADDPSASERRLLLTGASRLAALGGGASERSLAAAPPIGGLGGPGEPEETAAEARVGEQFSLVDAEVMLLYRVRPDSLLKFLNFSTDATGRRGSQTMRERAMRAIALRELIEYFSTLPLEDVLSPGRSGILYGLRQRIQQRFDSPEIDAGVEVVAVTIPTLRPPADAAVSFEELSIAVQGRRELRSAAERDEEVTMALLAGDEANAARVIAAIEEWERASAEHGADSPAAEEARGHAENLILAAGGQPAAEIQAAEATRWRTQMQARTDAIRLAGDRPMYEAAPELYRQRQIMEVLSQTLPSVRMKYLLGIPPERVRLDVEMQEVEAGFGFLENIDRRESDSQEGGSGS